MWPIVRRVATAVALTCSALIVGAAELPAVSSDRPWLAVLQRCAGVSLVIGAGLLALVPRPALVVLATSTALATGGFGFVGRPGRLGAVSMIAVALVIPLLLIIIRTVSDASSLGRPYIVAIGAVTALEFVRALVYEPFADVDCTGLCGHNPIVVSENLELAHNLGRCVAAATVLVAASAVLSAVRSPRSGRTRGSYGRLFPFCTVPAAFVLGADSAVRLTSDAVAVPADVSVAGLTVALVAVSFVSGALILTAIDPIRARRDVDRVARLLAQTDGASDVQSVFREGFGDPTLRVGYWADGVGYLDKDGASVGSPGGAQIELTSRRSPMAVIVHGRDAVSSELVAQQLGASARLAIHNESLTFELNRSVAEVARSRRRIVEVSDSERRRLERDLHDGAQQQLLALSFELRRGERAAMAAHDSRSAAGFSSANTLAQTALEQLRHLAHDIHPAILNGAGLHEALIEFAATSGREASITIESTGSIPAPVEATSYKVLVAAIAATTNAATPLIVVRRDDQRILLVIDRVSDLPQHAVDRAEAVGGTCTKTETGFEVALPCAC